MLFIALTTHPVDGFSKEFILGVITENRKSGRKICLHHPTRGGVIQNCPRSPHKTYSLNCI